MKKILFFIVLATISALLVSCQKPIATPEPEKDVPSVEDETPSVEDESPDLPPLLKVMSYNVRYDNLNDGYNSWNRRKHASIAMIDDIRPDVFGIQEALVHQVQYLAENTKGYSNVGVGRDDGVSQGEFMSIFWNTDIIEMNNWGTFWLSETPDTPSFGWDSACRRTATWTLMTDKRNGSRFCFINTHLDHLGVEARKNGLHLILATLAEINPESYPTILTGDFNMYPEDEGLAELDSKMTSTRKIALITDNNVTVNDFGKAKAKGPIDYIYVTGFKSVPEYHTVTEQYAGKRYISDHYPIFSVLEY